MGMTPRERVMAVLEGEEPDKTPIFMLDFMRVQLPGGWSRRLQERGLGIFGAHEFGQTETPQRARLDSVRDVDGHGCNDPG